MNPALTHFDISDANYFAGTRMTLAGVVLTLVEACYAFVYLAALLLLRVVLRRQWIAVVVLVLVKMVPDAIFKGGWSGWINAAATTAITVFILVRFGLLALMFTSVFARGVSIMAPAVLDPSAWHAGYSFLRLLPLIALAAYGFYISMAGRPVFSHKLLEVGDRGRP